MVFKCLDRALDEILNHVAERSYHAVGLRYKDFCVSHRFGSLTPILIHDSIHCMNFNFTVLEKQTLISNDEIHTPAVCNKRFAKR